MQNKYLTVKQLNLYVRSLIEGDHRLAKITVMGEISNFKNHYSSGHLYFTLKDPDASIKAVMFRTNAMKVKFALSDGMQVVVSGRVSLYEKDGQYQLYCEDIYPLGVGDIALQFEQIKEKLKSEGLFDESNKRKIPKFPNRIAVVTAKDGAAVRDIMNILTRRWPMCEPVLFPVSVQGENAVSEIISALDKVYSSDNFDVIILGRGGGSIEDLWAFNSEILARKIYESPIPLISAVGHETDFTIADFVADLRAPTPSAAAELAVPDSKAITELLDKYELLLKNKLKNHFELSNAKLSAATKAQAFLNPFDFIISNRALYLDSLEEKMKTIIKDKLKSYQNSFVLLAQRLDDLSPLKTLSKGYAAITKDGDIINSTEKLNLNDKINLRFSDGTAGCVVESINKE